jgi:calcium/calmodulin-dependent protein kinase I
VAVLKSLKHKYIIEIIDFFDEDDRFYLVMERMEGGDVFDRILKMKQYTERDARGLSKFLLEAVACMHQSGITHRDLKPQNLLLKSKDDNSDIKIADFGFACKVHTPQSLTTRCGMSFCFLLVLHL